MPGLPAHLLSLLTPEAYPHPVASVRLIETHISWLLLTGELAYKLKRPVCYPFVDLRSAERRAFFCAEEIRLNRRFAPQLYLDVCKVISLNGRARIGGEGEPIEHAVRMRQFDVEAGLDRLLAAGRVQPQELEQFGRDIAVIHAGLPVAGAGQPWGTTAAVRAVLLENLRQCLSLATRLGTQDEVRALSAPYTALIERAAPDANDRRAAGHVRECHGDLHSRNVVRHEGRLVAFDCIDFEPAFRWIDVAEEVAFLLMDLQARHAPAHAHAFLGGYLSQSGDYGACRLLPLYGVHRALVRAKVAALEASSASSAEDRASAATQHRDYLACARALLEPARPRLVLMAGLSGSGKTWLARQLAPQLAAVHVRSDVERKRLAGLAEHDRTHSPAGRGLYSPDSSERVYAHLQRCAEEVLAGGGIVIVDATFSRREDRARFRDLAERLGVPLTLIHCHAPLHVLQERVSQRQRAQADASEADLQVLEWQRAREEPILSEERVGSIEADTSRPHVVAEVTRQLQGGP